MTQIEIQIVDLLKQGFKYAQIQERLNVSSKTIAATKKAYFSFGESNTNFPDKETFQSRSDSLSADNASNNTDSAEKIEENNLFALKNQNIMNPNDGSFENSTNNTNLELEKYKLQLSYEFEVKKFNAEREDKKRELDLLEQQLQLKRTEINSFKKIDPEIQLLISQTKKIVYSCQDRAYTFFEINYLLNDLEKALKDCEEYCTTYNIEFRDSECQTILKKIESNLAEFINTFKPDKNGEMEYTFDYAFWQLKEGMTYQSI